MNDLKPKSKREHTEKQEFRRFMNICWGKFESLFVSGMVTVSKMDFPAAMRLKIYSVRVLNIGFFPSSLWTLKMLFYCFSSSHSATVNFIRGLLYANFKKRWERSTFCDVDRRLKSIHKLIIIATEKKPIEHFSRLYIYHGEKWARV